MVLNYRRNSFSGTVQFSAHLNGLEIVAPPPSMQPALGEEIELVRFQDDDRQPDLKKDPEPAQEPPRPANDPHLMDTETVLAHRLRASMYVRDAANNLVTSYVIDPANKVDGEDVATCVWSSDKFAMRVHPIFSRRIPILCYKLIAVVYMASSALEVPTRLSPGWRSFGQVISGLCMLALWVYLIVKLRCFWPNRALFPKCAEAPWFAVFTLSMVVSTAGFVIGFIPSFNRDIETTYGTLKVNTVATFSQVMRAFYLFYFSPRIRPAITSAFVIFGRLTAMFALIGVSFVCHYFAIKALTPHGSEEDKRFFNTAADGIWNLFVLLTTANHPDALMPLYHEYPIRAAVVLISFMTITFYFCMNVLLGVVYSEYQKLMSTKLTTQRNFQRAILHAAYLELRTCSLAVSGVDKDDLTFIMLQYDVGKADDGEKVDLWWQLLDADGSGELEFGEFCDMQKTVQAPVERVPQVVPDLTPTFPCLHWLVFDASLLDVLGESWAKNCSETTLRRVRRCRFEPIIDGFTIGSILWGLITSASDVCGETYTLAIEYAITSIFLLDVLLRLLGESRKDSKLFYLHSPYSWLDMVSTGLMLLGVITCSHSVDLGIEVRALVGIVRALRTFRLTQSILSLRRVVNCTVTMIPLVVPQLTMFASVYYTYAVIGMGLFAGDTTKTVETGGPGKWDTQPWSRTAYGAASIDLYYYDLNFDNLGSSIVTLFVCMVQNNWYVVVNGFTETNSEWVKLYFLSFNIVVVVVMVNIFVATLLSLYDILIPSSDSDSTSEAIQKEHATLMSRLNMTSYHATWRVKPVLKDNSILFQEEDDNQAQKKLRDQQEIDQTKSMLDWAPTPIYIQTANGMYTFCNRAYCDVVGMEVHKIIDTYDPPGKLKDQRCERRKEVFACGESCGNTEKLTHAVTGMTLSFMVVSRDIKLLEGGRGVITYLQEIPQQDRLKEMQLQSSLQDMKAIMASLVKGELGIYVDRWKTRCEIPPTPHRPKRGSRKASNAQTVDVIEEENVLDLDAV